MNIINLTPHAIRVVAREFGQEWTFEPSGIVARCTVSREVTDYLHLDWENEYEETEEAVIPITRTSFGAVENLPDPVRRTVYLVSSLVAQAVPHRSDVLIPDDTIRDEAGRIIGCRALARIGQMEKATNMVTVTYENGVEVARIDKIRGAFGVVHAKVVQDFSLGLWPEGITQATVEGPDGEFRVIG